MSFEVRNLSLSSLSNRRHCQCKVWYVSFHTTLCARTNSQNQNAHAERVFPFALIYTIHITWQLTFFKTKKSDSFFQANMCLSFSL